MMKEFLVVLFLTAFTLLVVNGVQANGDIIEAIEAGNKEQLLDLIEKGTDINECMKYGTPLSIAIRREKEEIAVLLVEKGADPNLRCAGVEYRSPLADATEAGLKTLVKVLLDKGVEINDEILRDVIFHDQADILEFIIQNGFDPNKEYDDCNQTWLYQAVIHGCVNVTKLLLKKGADIEHKDCDGRTAFIWACIDGEGFSKERDDRLQRGLELLIDSGANVNTADNIDKITPLMCAASWGSTTVAEKLIERGADVNAKDIYNKTALVQVRNADIAEMLIKKGANVNSKDIDNRTPLHRVYNTDVAELLIKKGADVNAMDKEGNTPWSIAIERRNENVANFLLKHGADIHKGEALRKKLAENDQER